MISDRVANPRRRPWRVCAAAVLALGALTLAACGGSPKNSSATPASTGAGGSKTVNLQFWSWVPHIQEAVSLYNQTHHGVHVTLNMIPQGTSGGYAKMLAALKAKNAPCLAQVEYQEIPTFLLANGLMNITKWATPAQGKFVPWQWQQGVFNGQVYAIPQASGPIGMFYRADIFKKDGITSPPATWSQFAADAATIHKKNPGQYITTFPTSNSEYDEFLSSMAWQNGAKWFGHTGNKWIVNIDSPQTVQVANYWDNLVSKGLVNTVDPAATAFNYDLAHGTDVAWVAPSWIDAILRADAPSTSGDWKVAPMPQWGGPFTSSNEGGSSTAVLTGCTHPAQAVSFATWLNSSPASINLLVPAGYGWPAVKNLKPITALSGEKSVFKFYGGEDINKVFTNADNHINESWGWIPTVSQTFSDTATGLSQAVNNHTPFSNVVASLQTKTVSDLKAEGLQVAK